MTPEQQKFLEQIKQKKQTSNLTPAQQEFLEKKKQQMQSQVPDSPYAGGPVQMPETTPTQESLPTLEDMAKGGVSDFMGLASLVPALGVGAMPGNTFQEEFQKQSKIMEDFNKMIGYDPESTKGVYGASGKALFDPLSYIPLGKGAAGLAKGIGSSMAGAAGAEKMTEIFPDSVLAAVVGGVVGSSGVEAGMGAVSSGLKSAAAVSDTGQALVDATVNKRVGNFLEDIQKANSSFLPDVKNMEEISDDVTSFIRQNGLERTQEVSPFLYTLMKTPKGAGYIKKAMEEDAIIDTVNKEIRAIQAAREGMKKNYEGMIQAGRSVAKDPKIQTPKDITLDRQIQSTQQALENIELNSYKELSSIDRIKLGKQINNVVETAERVVRNAMTSKYDNLSNRYKFRVAPEAIEELVGITKQDQLKSIFDPVPSEIKKDLPILKRLVKQDESEILDASGKPFVGVKYTEMGAKEFISLKNSVNRAYIKAVDPSVKHKLVGMKQNIEEFRKSLPEGFDKELRELDSEFRQRVGIDFIENGTIQKMKDSDFYSDNVNIILSKPEALDSVVAAVGKEEGQKIYKQAMLTRIYDKAFKPNDTLDLTQLARIKKQYREVFKSFPELESTFDNLRKNKEGVVDQLGKLELERKKYQDSMARGYFSIINKGPGGTNTLDSVVAQMQGTEGVETVRQVAQDLAERMKPEDAQLVKNSIAGTLMRKALGNPNTNLMQFADDNRHILEFAMPGQLEKIKNFGRYLSDEENFQQLIKNVQDKTGEEIKFLGIIPLPQVFSTLRSKVMSGVQKGAVIGSKLFEGRTRQQYVESLNKIMTDPNIMGEIDKLVKLKESGKISPNQFANGMIEMTKRAMINPAIIGTREGFKEAGRADEINEQDRQEIEEIFRRRGM